MRRNRNTVALLTITLAAAACGGEELDYGHDEQPLYYLKSSIWSQRDIPVCWETGGHATEKAWVEQSLRGQRSWTAAANINLTGWGACQSGDKGIRVAAGTKMVTSHLGTSGGGVVKITLDFGPDAATTWNRCTVNNLGRRDCIQVMALHEFGHALGFAHEQKRPDTPSTCTELKQGPSGDRTFGTWDGQSIMNYCNYSPFLSGLDRRGAAFLYGDRDGDTRRLRDFNKDGHADLLCHDVVKGTKWIDYADADGRFDGTDVKRYTGWCSLDSERLYKGDFDGDKRTDLLCHNTVTGEKSIDYADKKGRFDHTDWYRNAKWCNHDSARLFVGDFNGDERDDLLCHDTAKGTKWFDYADEKGRFDHTDWKWSTDWCGDKNDRLFVGRFNRDKRADLLCHDVVTGEKRIDYADINGRFDGIGWHRDARWCRHTSARLFIGDFDGDGQDDLLCHDVYYGKRWIDYADSYGRFYGTDWDRTANWCSHATGRLFVGKLDDDERDDLLCHDAVVGRKWVDYADEKGRFYGTDWDRAVDWCGHAAAELH